MAYDIKRSVKVPTVCDRADSEFWRVSVLALSGWALC